MLDQTVLFVVAKSAFAHKSHDNLKIGLSGSAPISQDFDGNRYRLETLVK